jgi:lipopolysaccharide export system protein LptC
LATTYAADVARESNFPSSNGIDTDRKYRVAIRHSRHVRWARAGVLACIAVVLFGVVAANYMPSLGEIRLPGELGKLVIKGTKITMQAPRLTGYTNDARPYEFTAHAAAQDITKPDFVELDQIHAKMGMADKSTVEMTAPAGLLNIKTNVLNLSDDIVLVSSTGYAARLIEATVDMNSGNVTSEKPVKVKLLNGNLNGKRMEITEKGNTIRFDGGVTMVLNPDKDADKAKTDADKAKTQ